MRAVVKGTTVFIYGSPRYECATEEEAKDLAERLNEITVL